MNGNIKMMMPDEYVDMNETDKALEASGPTVTSITRTPYPHGDSIVVKFDNGAYNHAIEVTTCKKGWFFDTVRTDTSIYKYDSNGKCKEEKICFDTEEVLNTRGAITVGALSVIGVADIGVDIAAACGAFN